MSAQAELQKLNKLNAVSYQRFVRAFKMVQAAQDKSCETDLIMLMNKVDTSNLLEYNHLMHILTKVRYKPVLVNTAGINLLDRMRKRGIYPDTVTYTSFINLLKKDRNADKAWLVFRRMREEKVQPNEWTYSTMAHICALKRNPKAAEELLGLMEEDRVVPNFIVMAGFVDAFLAAGQVERTWELIDSMRKQHRVRPNRFTLDYIMKSTLRENKEWDAWVEQHGEASATVATTPPAESDTESGATSSVSEREAGHASDAVSKKLERVKLVLRFLRREHGLTPSTKTFNALIAWCTKGKRTEIELAWRLKRLMKAYRLRPDNVTYVPLLNYYVKQLKARSTDSDIDYAEPQPRQGDEDGEDEGEGEECDDGSRDEGGLSADAGEPGVEEPYDGIQRTLQDMQAEGVESDPATTFTLIIDAHAASGDAERCFGAYADMRRDQVMPTVATYATLLRFCEKHGNVEKACALWEDIKADQIRLPWNVICFLLRATLTNNKTDTAFRLAEELSQLYKPQFVYSQLLTICDQLADVWQAERVWRVMRAKKIPVYARTKQLLADFGLNPDETHHT